MASVEKHGQVPDDVSTPGSNGANHDKPDLRETDEHVEFPPRKPKPSFVSRCITKLGLDVPTLLMMLK